MHRKSNTELVPLDPEIERTWFRRKKAKVDKQKWRIIIVTGSVEGQSDHNEIPGFREPTLGDCCPSMVKQD